MEDEAVRWRSLVVDHDRCHVSALACDLENRCVVLEYGFSGTDWIIFRHGNLPSHIVLRYFICSTTWAVVVPKSVRGCWLL